MNLTRRTALLTAIGMMSAIEPVESASLPLKRVSFSALSGWQADDHAAALETFRRSAREILATGHGFKRAAAFGGKREDWLDICKAALHASSPRDFFEDHFTACAVSDAARPGGLFTGYYEPEAKGSRTPTAAYDVPIYRRPKDLVALDEDGEKATGLKYGRLKNGKAQAYYTREEIEKGALKGKGLEIAYLQHWEDAFFIHIQGSGRILLPDGEVIRLAYALKTGLPYTGIGGVLVERGILTRQSNSMQAIRAWMKHNPAEARSLMWMNKSFVFFREVAVDDLALGALGAQQVHLTPRRSLAVDRSLWMFGTPVWLETQTPPESPGGAQAFNHLMVAQDTGTAIKGHARGDVYWGWGADAAQIAGHMKSAGRMHVLLPNMVASRLGLKS